MFKAFELPQGATPLFFKEVKYPQGTLHGFELADKRRFYAQLDGPGTNMYGYVSQLDNVTKFQNPMPPATGRQKAYLLFRYEENGVCGYRQYEDSYDFPVKTTNTVLPDLIQPATTPTVDKRFDACEQVTVVKIEGNSFRIKTTNGRVTVEGTWQTFGKCADCPEAAEKALQAALQKARDRNGGSITKSTPIVEKKDQSYGDAGVISYSEMKLMDILKNLSKTYNSLVDKAKVPEEAWQPDKEFFVRDGTGVISGALDQGIEEVKDMPELVGMGLKLVSDPQGAYNQLSTFAQNMNWEVAKSLAAEIAKSTVQYDNFSKGGQYARYGTGRVGVVIVKNIATIGAATLTIAKAVADAPNILKLFGKLRNKLIDQSKAILDALQQDLKDANFKTLMESADGENLVQVWELLRNGPNKLRKVYLRYLANPEAKSAWDVVKSANIQSKYPNLPLENITAIYHYTTEAYYDLNNALRNGNLNDYLRSFNEVLNESLDKLPKYAQTTYRGTAISEAKILSKYKSAFDNGTLSIEEAFLSTSKDFDIAKSFSDDVLQGDDMRVFFTVEGKNGVDIENISAYGPTFDPNYSESEILFKSNSPFRVTGFVEKVDSKGKYYEIKLTE